MMNRRWSRREVAALVGGLCVLATLFSIVDFEPIDGVDHHSARELTALGIDVQDNTHTSRRDNVHARRAHRRIGRRRRERKLERRAAVATQEEEETSPIFSHLHPLTETPNPSSSNVPTLFWHIPKCGGTTVAYFYGCLELTMVNRVGALPQFGHEADDKLIVFKPWRRHGRPEKYVNVDITNKDGIVRAEEMGLVPSGLADFMISPEPQFAIEHLFDEEHQGRAMGLFRHPVDRLVSKFYYLQVAYWERSYSPHWKNMSVLKWAETYNRDNEIMVRKLAGKRQNEAVGEEDLQLAMRTMKERFVVGLMDQMDESIRRFNIVVGIDESEDKTKKCMDQYFGGRGEGMNSNSHKKVSVVICMIHRRSLHFFTGEIFANKPLFLLLFCLFAGKGGQPRMDGTC